MLRNHISAIIACLLWSSAFAGIKIALPYTTPFLLAGIRFICSGLVVIPIVFLLKGSFKGMLRHWRYILIVAFFQTFLLYLLFFSGISLVTGAMGAIIIGSSPLWTAITTHFMTKDDRLNRHKIITSMMGIFGIAIISLTGKALGVLDAKELSGIGLLVLCGIVSAVGSLMIKRKPPEMNSAALNSTQLMAGGIALFIVSLLFEGQPSAPGALEFYMAFSWLVFLSATAFTLWFNTVAKKNVKVSDISMWKFLIPVSGAILSWLILPEESPDLISIAGIIIVSASLIFFFRSPAK